MRGITDFSIEKDRVTVLFLLIMAVAGLFSYLTYPKQEDPSIQIREAVVWAYFPGMPPQRVEDLITRKLEEQIRLLGDVDYIESDSKRGMSFMHVIARDEVPELVSHQCNEAPVRANFLSIRCFTPGSRSRHQ
jgi:multidrug efflux pump subunit AcrB